MKEAKPGRSPRFFGNEGPEWNLLETTQLLRGQCRLSPRTAASRSEFFPLHFVLTAGSHQDPGLWVPDQPLVPKPQNSASSMPSFYKKGKLGFKKKKTRACPWSEGNRGEGEILMRTLPGTTPGSCCQGIWSAACVHALEGWRVGGKPPGRGVFPNSPVFCETQSGEHR